MRAVVLSFDEQIGFVELLHKRYMELWPTCPFTFVVPFQDAAVVESSSYLKAHKNVEFRQAGQEIDRSMQAVLAGCEDSDWVYWCVDDRYPVTLHEPGALVAVYDAILNGNLDDRPGVRITRWREILRAPQLRIGRIEFSEQREAGMWGFWHHQFLRAEVLKRVFLDNPLQRPFRIRDLNDHFHRSQPLEILNHVLIPEENIIDFAEPCWEGKLTANGLRDLVRYGCCVPEYDRLEDVRIFDKQRREEIPR